MTFVAPLTCLPFGLPRVAPGGAGPWAAERPFDPLSKPQE